MKLLTYLCITVLILGGSVLYALPPGQESGPHLVMMPNPIVLPTLAAGSYINDTEAAVVINEGGSTAHIVDVTIGCPDSEVYLSAAEIPPGGHAYLGVAVNYGASGSLSCPITITFW